MRSPEPTKMEGSQLKNHSSLALIFGFVFGGGVQTKCVSRHTRPWLWMVILFCNQPKEIYKSKAGRAQRTLRFSPQKMLATFCAAFRAYFLAKDLIILCCNRWLQNVEGNQCKQDCQLGPSKSGLPPVVSWPFLESHSFWTYHRYTKSYCRLRVWIINLFPEINIAPETTGPQKETHRPTRAFQVLC